MRKMLKTLLGLTIVVLGLSVVTSSAMALPGDLIWAFNYNPSVLSDSASSVAMDGTGFYVVGYMTVGIGNTRWLMQKRNLINHAIVWSWTFNPSAGEDRAMAVAVDATGVYIVGFDSVFGVANTRWVIQKRSLVTGNLVWSRTFNPSGGDDKALSVAVSSAGAYVVGYGSVAPGNTYWVMQRINKVTGAMTVAMMNPSPGNDMATGVAVDGTGFYVVGFDSSLGGLNRRWVMQKRNLVTLAPIWIRTSNPTAVDDQATAVAVSSVSGSVYVVGYYGDAYGWRIERRSSATGNLFIAPINLNLSPGPDRANSVAVDATGFYVVGIAATFGASNNQWVMQKRHLFTGAFIWTRTSNPTGGIDWANDVAVIGGIGVYVVGYYGGAAGWRIERRQP